MRVLLLLLFAVYMRIYTLNHQNIGMLRRWDERLPAMRCGLRDECIRVYISIITHIFLLQITALTGINCGGHGAVICSNINQRIASNFALILCIRVYEYIIITHPVAVAW